MGFEVSLDYSWFVIFFLILATFTASVFPQRLPGLRSGTYLIMGLLATALFFASLLGHELAHSLVARRKGVEVEGITLFIFGGMARTKSEARNPVDELLIAGAGPLASFVFAALFYGLAAALRARAPIPPAEVMFSYLGLVNLALGAFNLLPGFPLDGGRLLRALVWKISGNLQRATWVATTAGRGLGLGLVALGVLGAFAGGTLVGGLWLIFIGWFLTNAAGASYRHLMLTQVLRGVTAYEAMSRHPEVVDPELTLDALIHEHFFKRPYNAFPVTVHGVLVGLVTLSQVKPVPREEWPNTLVREVMTPLADTSVVSPDTPMIDVVQRMAVAVSGRIMVVQNGRLEGIISARDLAIWMDRASLVD